MTVDGQPRSGWRVFDPSVGPAERIIVRAPLLVVASRGEQRLEALLGRSTCRRGRSDSAPA
jgi:hypothetical protein